MLLIGHPPPPLPPSPAMSYKKLGEDGELEGELSDAKEDLIDEVGGTDSPSSSRLLDRSEQRETFGSIKEEEHPTPISEPLLHDSRTLRCVRWTMAACSFLLLAGFLVAAIVLIVRAPACHSQELEWWQSGIIYQCYPQSFQDSNGDGIGDLKGILTRAPHFTDIGIGAVWLNPIFPSPGEDNGYDISNYTGINPLYGSLDDFESLLTELHKQGLKLILDFVPNHTSDQHPWFVESNSSRDSSRRDWYVWADPAPDGGPPNNWISVFGGSAWTLSAATGQYYLHQFSSFQPDLNYRNEAVRFAMEDVLKFWLDLDVDGFRVDAAKFLLEDPDLRNESVNVHFDCPEDCATNISSHDCYDYLVHNLTTNYPGIHGIIQSWRKLLDSYSSSTPRQRFMVGEVYDEISTVISYYGTDANEFNFPFNFFLLENTNWTGSAVGGIISQWLDAMPPGGWPNWVLGNHDKSRIASKAGVGLARALNMLLLTLPGTPTTYYGEEILMTDVYVPPPQRRDRFANRDPERTPMQWNTSANAGFTTGDPWLPLPDNYTEFNVEVEREDECSMLTLYKALASLRAHNIALQYSGYELLLNTTSTLTYRRYHASSTDEFLVAINFSKEPISLGFTSDRVVLKYPTIALSSACARNHTATSIDLKSFKLGSEEALVIQGKSESVCK